MTLKTRDIESSLLKKGFYKRNNDHKLFVFKEAGKNAEIITKISHSHNEINDDLIAMMAQQLYVSKMFFKDFVECSKSEADYIAELKSKNIIEDDEENNS